MLLKIFDLKFCVFAWRTYSVSSYESKFLMKKVDLNINLVVLMSLSLHSSHLGLLNQMSLSLGWEKSASHTHQLIDA